ncbi:hypothetical protein DWU99_15220 [Dyella psychrodurans]|uniref:Uncharacterized protein n=1 Tax=Dyella psychrodurans TaxID=1927960 RepID=A0A370X054_9GAMM|nr:hypothetical protein DWU99_15220 [Dyella psychrodurans]
MIDRNLQPVQWSEFMCELEDAKEHLANLIKEIEEDVTYDENNLRIDLGHVYAHLNRAWRRSMRALDRGDRDFASRFPDDLKPI